MKNQLANKIAVLEKTIGLLQNKISKLVVKYKYLQFENEALKREKKELEEE